MAATAQNYRELRRCGVAETLAGLAVVVNDDDETAGLVEVTVAQVRSARRSVSADRAREVAAKAARRSATSARVEAAGEPPRRASSRYQ